jgi:glycosyltransferase involved in cell wall biosynthesis
MKAAKISIVTPTYSLGQYIEETIRSVINLDWFIKACAFL